MKVFKNIFVLSLGFVFFNIFFPLLGIHFNSMNSFNFLSYDYLFVFYLFIIFLLTPTLVIFCISSILHRHKYNYINFIYFIFIFCVLKQIEFQISSKYYIQSNIFDLQIFGIISFIVILSIIIYCFSKKFVKHFYYFNKIIIFSSSVILIFVVYDITSIINNKNYYKTESKEISQINDTNKIFILTFEKLAYDLIVGSNNNIKTKFPSLKKIEKDSSLFTNFKSVSTQTHYALKALYNGKYLKTHKIDDNKSKSSIFKKLHKLGYKIHYVNDVINYPCRIIYVNCYKTNIGSENIVDRSVMARRWIYAFLQNYIPHFILWYINPTYEYDFKFVSRDETKETQNFLNILKNTENQKSAYIAHFFLSDGYTQIDELDNFKKKSLEDFDKFINKFYHYLKKNKIYKNSFIAIMSDTGSELSNIKMVYGSVKEQKYHRNSDKILFLIKDFNQNYSEKNKNHFSLFDFNNLFDHVINERKIDNSFEGNKKFNNKLFQFTDTGIIQYLKNNNKWVRK